MDELKKLTVYIQVYDRYKDTERLVKYFLDLFNGARLVILDNSLNKKKDFIILMKEYRNVYYFDFPYSTVYAEKIAKGINLLTPTKYSIICAQDDFLSLQGVTESIVFLEKNPEFIVCKGESVVFDKKKCFYSDFKGKSINNDFPLKRLRNHIINFSSTFYAVHRTDILKKIWEESLENTKDLRFGELLPSHLTAILGKIKTLRLPVVIREASSSSDGRTSDSLISFIKKGTFWHKYKKYRESLIHNSQELQENRFKCLYYLDYAFCVYLKNKFVVNKLKFSNLKKKNSEVVPFDRINPLNIDPRIRELINERFSEK
jgi:glycosyltransferase domain-containing protein